MSKALLVMDIQVSIVSRYDQSGVLVQKINESITAAEKAGIPVIYVTVAFREGFPEIHANNKMFGRLKNMPAAAAAGGSDLPAELKVLPNGIHVQKRRVSAFAGSDLDVILRANQITELVLCGIATAGVVLSTLREAADKDYTITVLHDCCGNADQEVHDVLVNKVFPMQAEVVSNAEWIAALANN